MKISVSTISSSPKKFPYLVIDKHLGYVLVSKYSAIALESESGDGFDSHVSVVRLDPSSFKDRWKDVPAGTSLTLTQD